MPDNSTQDFLRERVEAAEEVLRRDAVQRAWGHGLMLVVFSFIAVLFAGLIPVLAEVVMGVRDPENPPLQEEIAARLSWMSAPFSESVVVVLPAMLAAVLALAVVNAVGKVGPKFVIATANTATWLALVWTMFALFAVIYPPAGMQVGAVTRVLAAGALAAVTLAVNVLIAQMTSAAEAARDDAREKSLRELTKQLDHTRTGEIPRLVSRRYGRSPSARRARWSIRLWYLAATLFAVGSAFVATTGRPDIFPGLLVFFVALSFLTLATWTSVLRAVLTGRADSSADGQMFHARAQWWMTSVTAALGAGLALSALGKTDWRMWVLGVGLYFAVLLFISLAAYLPLLHDVPGRSAIARLILLIQRDELEGQVAALEDYKAAVAAARSPAPTEPPSPPAPAPRKPWWKQLVRAE
jgi:hypothetical protein